MSTESLRIVWIYPDLLSTYGDRGNLLILATRARRRGVPVETIEIRSDQPLPDSADIYLLGGGEDGPQALGAERLLADGGLHRAVARGSVVFGVCAGIARTLGLQRGEQLVGSLRVTAVEQPLGLEEQFVGGVRAERKAQTCCGQGEPHGQHSWSQWSLPRKAALRIQNLPDSLEHRQILLKL